MSASSILLESLRTWSFICKCCGTSAYTKGCRSVLMLVKLFLPGAATSWQRCELTFLDPSSIMFHVGSPLPWRRGQNWAKQEKRVCYLINVTKMTEDVVMLSCQLGAQMIKVTCSALLVSVVFCWSFV